MGLSQAKKIVKEFKPDIVIGTGGYICGAMILAAHKYKIPTMLHESNAFPGKAVKMLAKRTDVIMVSFKDALNRIPNAKKIVLTGTPTRNIGKKLSMNDKIKEIEKYNLNPSKMTILIFGGSQGAKIINDTIIDLAEKNLNKNYQILLVAGQKQYDIVKQELKSKDLDIERLNGIRIVPYIYEMAEIIEASDILVCRAGATTVTEVTKHGKPAIFIPLPNVSHNHQKYNAEVLKNAKAAEIINNEELNSEKLDALIQKMLDKDKLKEMGENARQIAINNVEDKIYEEIKKLVNK